MKILIFAICMLIVCFSPSPAWAQNCKPDSSGVDPISKQQIDIWLQTVSRSGVALTIWVGRRSASGTQVGVVIEKQEAAATSNTQFQSALQAVKGNQFYFGLSNRDPLTFVASEVSNEARVSGSFMAGFTGKNLVTVVQMWALVQDKELAALRDALTQKQIDAVRVILAGDVRIERVVDEKNGKKLMDKFSCFYQSLDKAGIDLSVAPKSESQPMKTASPSNSSAPVEPQKGTEAAQLTNEQIIQMAAAKLPDDVIIATIRKSGSKFDLTPEALIKLKAAGVSDAVLRAMMQ